MARELVGYTVFDAKHPAPASLIREVSFMQLRATRDGIRKGSLPASELVVSTSQADQLRPIRHELERHFQPELQLMDAWNNRIAWSKLLVALQGMRCIGKYEALYTPINHSCELYGLSVDPDYQGRGIAKGLRLKMIEVLEQTGAAIETAKVGRLRHSTEWMQRVLPRPEDSYYMRLRRVAFKVQETVHAGMVADMLFVGWDDFKLVQKRE